MTILMPRKKSLIAGWLSKKAHIQGVAVFQERDYTL